MQKMGMTKYVRVCDEVFAIGEMLPADTWHEHITDVNKNWFRSITLYTNEQYEQFKKQGRVKGITGGTSNFLIFDFDNKADPSASQKDALILIERLKKYNIHPNNYNITFSGNKGFGIEIFLDRLCTCPELLAVATTLSKGLKTWDSSMYDEPQLMRVPGTRHKESGLYKTILSEEQIKTLTIAQIRDLAKTIQPGDWTEEPNALPGELFISNTPKETKKVVNTGDIDFSKRPHDMPKWKYLIMHGLFPPGHRHDSLLALAAHFKGLGYPAGATISVVLEASRLQYEAHKEIYGVNDPTNENEITAMVNDVYGPSWKGGTYEGNEELKNKICPDDAIGENEKTIVTVKDMSNNFTTFAKNIKYNRIVTGLPELDKKVTMTTGMLVGLLAGPGAGKTAMAFNFLNHTSIAGIPSMFFSLDMGQNMVYAKLISREHNISFEKVIEAFELGDPCVEQWMQELSGSFEKVGFYFRSGTTVDGIRQQILRYQNEVGEKVKFVVIDYLEMIAGPHADATANSASHATKLKDLATDLDICLMVLIQPPKSAGGAGKPLTNMQQVKGSSMLEQNFRIILGVYREGFHPDYPEDDNFITIKGLKNTFGPLFTVDLGWEGMRGRIYSLNQDGKNDLKKLRERKAAEAAEKDDGWVGGGKF